MENKLNVLRVLDTFQGELKYSEHYITDELYKYNVETTFLTSTGTPVILENFLRDKKFKPGYYTYNKSKVIRLKTFRISSKDIFVKIKKVYILLRDNEYDLIHIQGIGTFITFQVLFCLFFLKKIPKVLINDNSIPFHRKTGFKASIFYYLNRFLFYCTKNFINKIIIPNEESYRYLKNFYRIEKSKLITIPLGYDATTFKYLKDKKNFREPLVIGFAGKIVRPKNIELLLDVVNQIDGVECIVVGMNQENLSEYQKELLRYKSSKITFFPLIKDVGRLVEFYNYIDIAIFPGGVSITTIEATGCGTPVVIYEFIGGLEDRVDEGRGKLFISRDELKDIIEDYKYKKEHMLINNIKIEKATLKYSWEVLAKEYLKLYQNILENK